MGTRTEPSMVMMHCDSEGHGIGHTVIDGSWSGRSLDELASSREGMLGAFQWVLSRYPHGSRCALLDRAGSLSDAMLDVHGIELMEAWVHAFGEHRIPQGPPASASYSDCHVVDLDRRECVSMVRGRLNSLPYLLYVGPEAVCDRPCAGRWAFDRLVVASRAPLEGQGFTDVSQVAFVRCWRPTARAGTAFASAGGRGVRSRSPSGRTRCPRRRGGSWTGSARPCGAGAPGRAVRGCASTTST